jgi:uncharacterized protein (TIGR03067 family)
MNIVRYRNAMGALILAALALCVVDGLAREAPVTSSDPVDNPLGSLLAKHGYFAVPIDLKNPDRPIVHGHINDHPAAFLIDTAANESTLYRHVVDALKLPTTVHGKVKMAAADQAGVKQKVTTTVELLKIGGGLVRKCHLTVDDKLVGLDPATLQKIERNDPFMGIIGDNTLAPNQALIDFQSANLYLRRQGSAVGGIADELAALFRREGYVAVACTKKTLPYVRCKVGGHDLTLLVDTGSRNTMFDHTAAGRIGFIGANMPTGGLPPPPGGKPTTVGPLPAPLVLPGGLEVPEHNLVFGYDFSALNRGLEAQGLPRTDGLMGVNLLQYFSAVMDYSRPEPRLFLIDPAVKDGKLLDGEWAGEAAEISGRPVPADDAKKAKLAIGKDNFDLQLWEDRLLGLRIDGMCPDPTLRTIDLISKGPDKTLTYLSIYEVSRDRLRVCMPLDVKPGENIERPKEFKSKPSSP